MPPADLSPPGGQPEPVRQDPPVPAGSRQTRRPARWLYAAAVAIVFGLSAGLRLLIVLPAGTTLISDARDYYVLAHNLSAGRGYMQEYQGETQAFQGFTFRAFRSPGYPAFLAALFTAVGWEPGFGLLANVAADLVMQACFWLVALRILGPWPALVVQVLLGLYVLWTPGLTSEPFFLAQWAVLVLLIVRGWPRRDALRAGVVGLLLAAAIFTRPVAVSLVPVLLWQAVWPRPRARALLLLIVVLLPAISGIGAWAWRNQRIFGQPVWLTTNFGLHNARDLGLDQQAMFAYLRDQGYNEAQINSTFLRVEWQIVRQDPGRALALWARRAAGLFSLRPPYELDAVLWRHTLAVPGAELARKLHQLSCALLYLTYPMAGLGTLLLLWRRPPLAGLPAIGLSYVMIHALVSRGDLRLAAPLYPLMCVAVGSLLWQFRRLAQASMPGAGSSTVNLV